MIIVTPSWLLSSRTLEAFDCVTLITRMLHWNDHRFYLEHIVYVKGQVCAHTYIEGLVRGPKGHLKPNEVFKELGVTRQSPPLPEKMQGWVESLSVKYA